MTTGTNQPARHRRRAPGRISVVAAVVPMVLMGSAWTAAMAQSDGSPQAAGANRAGEAPGLPDTAEGLDAAPVVSTLPTTTPLGPAAVTSPNGASNEDIPVHSVAAYKRTATVLAGSRAACRLPWSLVAAIGKVESNHGRFGGNAVGDDGVSRPGIRGIALDGTNNTARILDTDGGSLDNDATFDRAVGPMQFIPSTWRAVAVDGDGDGVKNPQDIDDAAMSAGVYLCAAGADLSTPGGARSAVLRYNQSGAYADLVLSISARYAAGDFSEAPDGVVVPQAPGAPTEVNTPEKGKAATPTPRDRGATTTPRPPSAPTPGTPSPSAPPSSGTPTPGTPSTPPTSGSPSTPPGSTPPSSGSPTRPTTPPSTSPTRPTNPPSSDPTDDPNPPKTNPPPPPPTTPSEPEPSDPPSSEPTDPPSTGPESCADGELWLERESDCVPVCPDDLEPDADNDECVAREPRG